VSHRGGGGFAGGVTLPTEMWQEEGVRFTFETR